METPPKPVSTGKIFGYNMLVFAIYGGIGQTMGNDAKVGVFFIALIHFMISCCLAIYFRQWVWFLSGLLILLIGFGSCVSGFHLDTR